MPEPEADCSQLEHGEERRPEFVIARGQAFEIFDLVEESLDPVAVFVEHLAETVSLRAEVIDVRQAMTARTAAH